MKRKLYVLAGMLVSSLLLTACGSKEYLKDIKAEKYVTLGNYKGVEVSVQKTEVPEGAVENFIQSRFLAPKAEKVPVTGRPVQSGDVVNIDFVGYQDGVAFEGGTGENFDLTIGSGQFIAGFEEGLVGANAGDKVSLDLKFPDPYERNPDLSGAPVVFEVTVNSISENKLPELTDELVKQLGEEGYQVGTCQTAAELRDWIQELYDQSAQSDYENRLETALASAIMDSSTFQELPEELVARYTGSVEKIMSAEAASNGMTLAQYMQLAQGLDEAGYKAAFAENGARMAKQYVMYQAIADQEGLTPTEEEIAEETAAIMAFYQYSTEEEMAKNVDMKAIGEDLMRKKVVAFLIENANIQAASTVAD